MLLLELFCDRCEENRGATYQVETDPYWNPGKVEYWCGDCYNRRTDGPSDDRWLDGSYSSIDERHREAWEEHVRLHS